jgi:hypothetical protein
LSPGFTTGIGAGDIVGVQVGEATTWLGEADGEADAVVPEPPQAARASSASRTSTDSTPTTIVDDPRFP